MERRWRDCSRETGRRRVHPEAFRPCARRTGAAAAVRTASVAEAGCPGGVPRLWRRTRRAACIASIAAVRAWVGGPGRHQGRLGARLTESRKHAPRSPCSPRRPAVVRPLAPSRYQVQVTVSAETHAKLRRAQDLLRHAVPDGDPAAVLDRALTVLLQQLERTKCAAKAAAPRDLPPGRSEFSVASPDLSPRGRSRTIPAAVRRAVWARDGGRCDYVGSSGRCTERSFLEFHHRIPFAAGGESSGVTWRSYVPRTTLCWPAQDFPRRGIGRVRAPRERQLPAGAVGRLTGAGSECKMHNRSDAHPILTTSMSWRSVHRTWTLLLPPGTASPRGQRSGRGDRCPSGNRRAAACHCRLAWRRGCALCIDEGLFGAPCYPPPRMNARWKRAMKASPSPVEMSTRWRGMARRPPLGARERRPDDRDAGQAQEACPAAMATEACPTRISHGASDVASTEWPDDLRQEPQVTPRG